MSTVVRYGIFGGGEAVFDDDGFIEVPVIVQESGCYVGVPPPELRIHTMGIYNDDEGNRQMVAMMNRKTDLPFYLTTAKIKIVGKLECITDAMNDEAGISKIG